MATKEEIETIFQEFHLEPKSIAIDNGYYIVKAGYIKDMEVFKSLLTQMRGLGAERINDGKNSHWKVRITFPDVSTFTPSDPQAFIGHIDDIIIRLEGLKKEAEGMLKK